jgi:hypothetical protein
MVLQVLRKKKLYANLGEKMINHIYHKPLRLLYNYNKLVDAQ